MPLASLPLARNRTLNCDIEASLTLVNRNRDHSLDFTSGHHGKRKYIVLYSGMLNWCSRLLVASQRWSRSIVLLRQLSEDFGRITACSRTSRSLYQVHCFCMIVASTYQKEHTGSVAESKIAESLRGFCSFLTTKPSSGSAMSRLQNRNAVQAVVDLISRHFGPRTFRLYLSGQFSTSAELS